MKKLIFFIFLALLTCNGLYCQPIQSKTCKTCGEPLKECPYKGKHPKPPEQQTPTTGTLSLTSSPSGATVKIDGKYKGETPLTMEKQKPGSYSITFSKEGYVSSTKTASVTAGKTANCHANLSKKQSQQQQQQTSGGIRMDGNDIVFTLDGTTYRYKMVYVSGGTFTMGCTSEQGSDCDDWEKPAHSVTVSGYYIGQTEVTQALWKVVMGEEPTYNGGWEDKYGRGANHPAYRVSYDDIKTFISRLNSKTGMTFRLPTEEEWEFAARGGNSSRGYKYSGSNSIGDVAWYEDNSGSKTHPVKQKQANELGLYDMSGNVWEWCSSPWCSDYNSARSGSLRVHRGGSWYSGARFCRVSYRGRIAPSGRDDNLGLRLAR